MATISRVTTWSDGQTLTASALNAEFNNILNDYNGGITNANISASAVIGYSKLSLTGSIVNADLAGSIADSKLSQITTASKVSGAALTSLASIPAGAGVIPAANVPSSGITSKVFSFTRDVSAANGNVSYTGIGFTPTALKVTAGAISANATWCSGQSDSTKAANCVMQSSASVSDVADTLLYVSPSGGTNMQATIVSYDADGFTLAYTKTGSPTGTLTVKGVAYK